MRRGHSQFRKARLRGFRPATLAKMAGLSSCYDTQSARKARKPQRACLSCLMQEPIIGRELSAGKSGRTRSVHPRFETIVVSFVLVLKVTTPLQPLPDTSPSKPERPHISKNSASLEAGKIYAEEGKNAIMGRSFFLKSNQWVPSFPLPLRFLCSDFQIGNRHLPPSSCSKTLCLRVLFTLLSKETSKNV